MKENQYYRVQGHDVRGHGVRGQGGPAAWLPHPTILREDTHPTHAVHQPSHSASQVTWVSAECYGEGVPTFGIFRVSFWCIVSVTRDQHWLLS